MLEPMSVETQIGVLTEKIQSLIERIDKLESGTLDRIKSLETEKADRVVQDKINALQKIVSDGHDVRIRALEMTKSWIWVICFGIVFIIGLLIFHLTGYHI